MFTKAFTSRDAEDWEETSDTTNPFLRGGGDYKSRLLKNKVIELRMDKVFNMLHTSYNTVVLLPNHWLIKDININYIRILIIL